MHHVVHKHVAFRTKIVAAVRTSIPTQRANALRGRRSGRRRWKRAPACMTHVHSLSDFFYRRPANLGSTKPSASKPHHRLHSLIGLDRKQVVITPRKMRGTHDHQATNVTIRRHVANFGHASRTEKALALHVRMAYTKTRWRRVGEARRKPYHHQVRGSVCGPSTASAGYGSLGWRGNKLKQ